MFTTFRKKLFFAGKNIGVTKEGEPYVSIFTLDDNSKKYNFLILEPDLIDKFNKLNLNQFDSVVFEFILKREFNRNTRFSHWSVELVGVISG